MSARHVATCRDMSARHVEDIIEIIGLKRHEMSCLHDMSATCRSILVGLVHGSMLGGYTMLSASHLLRDKNINTALLIYYAPIPHLQTCITIRLLHTRALQLSFNRNQVLPLNICGLIIISTWGACFLVFAINSTTNHITNPRFTIRVNSNNRSRSAIAICKVELWLHVYHFGTGFDFQQQRRQMADSTFHPHYYYYCSHSESYQSPTSIS